jgi:hypothetical protein
MGYIGALIMSSYTMDTALQYPGRVCMPPPLNSLNVFCHIPANMQQQNGTNKTFFSSLLKISAHAYTSYAKGKQGCVLCRRR